MINSDTSILALQKIIPALSSEPDLLNFKINLEVALLLKNY